jgi:tRNA(Ile)-lysidine synthase TilS/MesJ
MIEANDKIAVGVSGGKDSLTLLAALAAFRRFSEIPYQVIGITIDMGFEGVDYAPVAEFCKQINVEYIIKKTDIAEILFDVRKEKNPCSLCSRMRRGAVNDLAKENGCNKVALGHNNEDVIETFFLSLFYEGRLNSFSPFTYLSRKEIAVIRPLIYASESDIRGYAKRAALPIVKNPCPMDGISKRQNMKDFINEKTKSDRHFKARMMHAIQTGLENWRIE